MKKVTAFIDGLSLYHSLPKENNNIKCGWLNLRQLCKAFIKKSEVLNDLYWFTALPQWNEEKVKRQQSRLQKQPGLRLYMEIKHI